MRRHLLGIIGLLFLVAWIVLPRVVGTDGDWRTVDSVCMRVGLVLTALWLAFPQVIELFAKYPPWLIALFVAGLLLFAYRPRTIVIIGPVLAVLALLQFVGWLFKPLPTNKPPANKSQSSGKRPPS